jgi:hypothetical protein
MFGVFPDYSIEVVEVRDLGDLTFATIRLRGHGAGSAAPTDQATWIMVRWRRGKCVWWRTSDARAEVLEAVEPVGARRSGRILVTRNEAAASGVHLGFVSLESPARKLGSRFPVWKADAKEVAAFCARHGLTVTAEKD